MKMKAMIIDKITDLEKEFSPLKPAEFAIPRPKEREVLIKVTVCGVCHTEIDEIEGRTPPPHLPVVPGHQAVGEIVETGHKVKRLKKGDRVGVAWIFKACGRCEYCRSGQENLCRKFTATGRDVHGGYAEYMVVDYAFAHKIPDRLSDSEAAPLLCAGAIGYRSLRLTGMKDGDALGLTGFGASAHLVLKLARYLYPRSKIYVFARSKREREFAVSLGAAWAGDTIEEPPGLMHAIIDTTPAWLPVVSAMKWLKPGGRLVINAIRKEAGDVRHLTEIEYENHLWMEKEIKSVANVTRKDVSEFLKLAAEARIMPQTKEYALEDANKALLELKQRNIKGAKILRISHS
jgi:propanol-preferring alcohol dehydrogenase